MKEGNFKLCAGCFDTHYCSPKCQKDDWNRGTHREYCQEIQEVRKNGGTNDISRRDYKFIVGVLHCDVSSIYKSKRVPFEFTPTPSGPSPVRLVLDYCAKPVLKVDLVKADPPGRRTTQSPNVKKQRSGGEFEFEMRFVHIIASIPRGETIRHVTRVSLIENVQNGAEML